MTKRTHTKPESSSGGLLAALSVGAVTGAVVTLMLQIVRAPRRMNRVDGGFEPTNPAEEGQPDRAPLPAKLAAPSPKATASLPEPVEAEISPYHRKSTRWSRPTKYFVSAVMLVTLVWLIYIGRNIWSTVILAALIAFIVRPIIGWNTRKLKLKKGQAVALTYFMVVVVVALIPLVLLPAILNSVNFVLAIDFQAMLDNGLLLLNNTIKTLQEQPLVNMVVGSLLTVIAETLESLTAGQPVTSTPLDLNLTFTTVSKSIAQSLGTMVSVLGPIFSALISVVFTVLISLQLSLSWDHAAEAFPRLFPPAYKEDLAEVANAVGKTWNAFLRGQLVLMLAIGLITWVGAVILGAPQPVLLGLIAGLLEIIPSIGPFIAGFVGVLLSLIFGSSVLPVNNLVFGAIVLGFYVIVQLLENQVFVPKIMGDAVDLPPVVVLVGVMFFGSAFGLLGIFLSTPIIATVRIIFNYLYNKILEPPEEPELPDEDDSIMENVRGFFKRFRMPWQTKKDVTPTARVQNEKTK